MEGPDTPGSSSKLLCLDDAAFLNEDDVYIEELLQKESLYFGSESLASQPIRRPSWLAIARMRCLGMLLKVRRFFSLQFRTVHLSMTYFDLFLAIHPIPDGQRMAVRALAVTCLTLAVKVQETARQAAKVSLAAKSEKRKLPDRSLFLVEGCHFENEQVILEVLDWDVNLVTPYHYLPYFVNKFYGESRPEGSFYRDATVKLLVEVSGVTDLRHYKPSVMAAAAVLVAIDDGLTEEGLELKMRRISLRGSLENEQVFSFYNLMQKLKKRQPLPNPPQTIVDGISSMHCLIGVIKNSSSPVAVRIKKKLPFINAHKCPITKGMKVYILR